MYKCKDCGREFDEPYIHKEGHGFVEPPFEKQRLCPNCKGNNFFELIPDSIRRTNVLEDLIKAQAHFNEFRRKVEGVLNEVALDGTGFDYGISELYELFYVIAGGKFDGIELPDDIDEKFFSVETEDECEAFLEALTKNIE